MKLDPLAEIADLGSDVVLRVEPIVLIPYQKTRIEMYLLLKENILAMVLSHHKNESKDINEDHD
jgi:hypothetical protein